MWHAHDGMGWWMLFGGLWTVLFWALLVWVVIRLAEVAGDEPRRQRDPVDIARDRYARGEITRDEFRQLRADLEGGPEA